MVISAAVPRFQPGAEPVAEEIHDPLPLPIATTTGKRCPRCTTQLVMSYDEPTCLRCGYQDYTYTGPSNSRGTSILSTATRFILRYVGDSGTLDTTLAHVRVVRVRNRVVFEVNCPFSTCEKVMEQSSLSGKRPEVREQRYRCNDGHRVSLVPGDNGMLGWK